MIRNIVGLEYALTALDRQDQVADVHAAGEYVHDRRRRARHVACAVGVETIEDGVRDVGRCFARLRVEGQPDLYGRRGQLFSNR